MEFKFKAEVVLQLDHTKGDATSKHAGTGILPTPYLPLDRAKYVKRDGKLTADGAHVMMRALTSGLSATIHYAHEQGFIDSAENLRKVIHQLEQEFIQVPRIEPGEMPA